ncbi:MAG: hypothetical protein JNK60_20905 [Acidobacteria bacterium]|nr:hypothetical protein [Acidobacteriota bacterium]
MNAISRSFEIFKASLEVLKKDKEILLFPILSGTFTVVAFLLLAFGGWVTGFFAAIARQEGLDESARILGYAALFVWYFVSWFIVLFFNTALVACARIRMEGGDPVTADGFKAAMDNLGAIAMWAAVSATVGVILQVIADRMKGLGDILKGLLGAAWSIATFFIVPVLIFEKRSLGDSIKQSTRLVKATWGEALTAHVGVGLVSFLISIPAVAFPILGGVLFGGMGVVAGLGIMILWWLGVAILSAALTGIFRTGLYLYATKGEVPSGLPAGLVKGAFTQ